AARPLRHPRQQAPQIAITLIGDTAHLVLATTQVLSWDQPDPCREFAGRLERRIHDSAGYGRSGNCSNTRDGRQPPADRVRSMLAHDHGLDRLDAHLKSASAKRLCNASRANAGTSASSALCNRLTKSATRCRPAGAMMPNSPR